jgi:outer membrane lipase/esterase
MILAFGATTPVRAEPRFDALVVLGDSLSDSGNAGRSSNGRVWVEYLAEGLGLPLRPNRLGGTNFAVGGARLDPASGGSSLPAQATMYLRAGAPGGRALHVVWGGGNDLLAAVGNPRGNAIADVAVAAAARIVSDLVARGATELLVPNLPDLGMTPAVRNQGAAAVADATRLSERFNAGLAAALLPLEKNPVRIHRLDVFGLSRQVRADPQKFGFSVVDRPCGQSGNCAGFVFWDGIHPTTEAHCRLAEAALRSLAPP